MGEPWNILMGVSIVMGYPKLGWFIVEKCEKSIYKWMMTGGTRIKMETPTYD